ncbi:Acetylcholine receptor-like protein cup-4 [Aphelenchoides bicaudatus]|nr:Acetylcholine receptor-like protein cup-4 [Aphelenchoides bicaudatus]
MKSLLRFFAFCLFFNRSNAQISFADLTRGEADDNNPEVIQNRSYVEHQTALQRQIFAGYDRSMRPRRNQNLPTVVSMHMHLMHFSVQERKQSIKVFGHLYLNWFDEFATWDPSKFNNVKTTMVSQWETWQPDIKVANSISGVNQFFEVSKRSHSTLTSVDQNRTKVELYPTFSISVGCDFDFTNWPFDEQTCDLRFYTSSTMNEVELSLYYNLNPSVVLSWDEDSNKRHISEWQLVDVLANSTYFRYRNYNNTRPTNPFDIAQTWSMITCTILLRRNSLNYWYTLALPGFSSLVINLLSFFVYKVETSMLMMAFNLLLQVIFLHDALDIMPPSVGGKPNIIIFASGLMFFTFAALMLQIWLKLSSDKKWSVSPQVLKYTKLAGDTASDYWKNFSIWVNAFGFFTIPVQSTVENEPGEYESFQESDAEVKPNGKVVMLNEFLRKVCIAAYLFLTFVLAFLLFF